MSLCDTNPVTYLNTAENAHKVGWVNLPEYCFGDKSSKFVTHDHKRGLFYFHNVDVDGWMPQQ